MTPLPPPNPTTPRPPPAPPNTTSIFPVPPIPLPTYHIPTPKGRQPPRVPSLCSPPSDPIATHTQSRDSTADDSVASRTCSSAQQSTTLLAHAAARCAYPSALIHKWALLVLDKATGKTLEYRQLIQHPYFHKVWNHSYANKLGRLFQGIGTSPNGTSKRIKGTDTFFVIQFENIPADRRSEITYTKVVCKVRPEKSNPNRTRITIGVNSITFPGNAGTPTASLELAKLDFNSVLSRPSAKFTTFDICNFYLQTPLDRPEYAHIKLSDIPEEFTMEYNLISYARDGWVYFEI